MISCRNFLIYLQREAQRKLIELFHYVLNPDACLVLGTSESIDTALFSVVDKTCCVFQKRNVRGPDPRLPVFPMSYTRPSSRPPKHEDGVAEYERIHRELSERHNPPTALLTPDDQLAHLSSRIGRFFVHPDGPPTTNIFKLALPEMRAHIRLAVTRARATKLPVVSEPLVLQARDPNVAVTIHAPSLTSWRTERAEHIPRLPPKPAFEECNTRH